MRNKVHACITIFQKHGIVFDDVAIYIAKCKRTLIIRSSYCNIEWEFWNEEERGEEPIVSSRWHD